jgi:hypothetical protein
MLHPCRPQSWLALASALLISGCHAQAGIEGRAIKVLDAFMRQHPNALAPRGRPYGTSDGPLGLPRAVGQGRTDLADGFSWRKCQEAVASSGVR